MGVDRLEDPRSLHFSCLRPRLLERRQRNGWLKNATRWRRLFLETVDGNVDKTQAWHISNGQGTAEMRMAQ
jgi:hypothetical protein